jgi:membrane protein required for colicin V production
MLAVMAASLMLGAWRGLVYEVLSVMSWIAAFIVAQIAAPDAQIAAPDAALLLPMGNASQPIRYAAGFVVVFIGVVFAGALLAFITKKLVEAVGLRPVDRILGAAFGVFRGVLLMMALAVVVNLTPLRNAEWWNESQGAGIATAAVKGLKPVLPERFGQYLPG